MRRLLSLAFLGTALVACNGQEDAFRIPDPCADTTVDTVVFLWPDSLRMAVGAVDMAYLDGGLVQCNGGEPLPPDGIEWTVRDPSVVAPQPEQSGGTDLWVESQAPGRTWILADGFGQVDSLPVTVPDTVPMGPSDWMAAGVQISCSVEDTGQVFCWGVGYAGLLGDPEDDPAVGTCWGTPCSPMPVPRMTGAVTVAIGSVHACALDATGTALCWGDNETLQVGPNAGFQSADPVETGGGLTFSSLTLGSNHTCGLTADGAGYCWGEYRGGRLGGDRRTGPVGTPVEVSSTLRFSSLEAGGASTCGSGEAGGLYCWGYFSEIAPPPPGAESCETGAGKSGPTYLPCSFVPLHMPLGEGHGADTVFVEIGGRCALSTAGSVSCLDENTGAFEAMAGFGPFTTLVGGRRHHCGLTEDGTAWCWGDGGEGALGDGTGRSREAPVAVSGGHVFEQIAAGDRHTCGRTPDGTVWCWGANDYGQAGVPVLDRPLAPVRVRGQG